MQDEGTYDIDGRCYDGARWREPGTPLTAAQRWLRRKILKLAAKDPGNFQMDTWETRLGCGTQRCMAGWAQFLMTGAVDRGTVRNDAIGYLGLTRDEYFGTASQRSLFYERNAAALRRLQELAKAE